MSTKKVRIIFLQSLAGVFSIVVLSFYIFLRGNKNKFDFYQASGKITYLEKSYQDFPNRHYGKYRYLQIDKYSRVFELFAGKDFGDFKPDMEKIDELKMGDKITIFYDEITNRDDVRLNRLAQFIDKGKQPYFIRGSKDKYFGYFGIGIGLVIGGWLFYLKSKGKIA